MTRAVKPACPRLFEVEALRDGRIMGAEVARLEAHLGVCPVCAREARMLEAMAEALRLPTHAGGADELHLRRERTRLLAAFDASLVPAPRGLKKSWAAVAVGVLLLSALLLARVLGRSHAGMPAVSASASASAPTALPEPVVIHADTSALWSRRSEGQFEKVFLESGALSIRVQHAGAGQRLLVILPDGEIEDIGTAFSVSAAAGHTTRVTVQDGSVVLRLRGAAPLVLGAGDAWSPAPPPAAPSSASSHEPVRHPSASATVPAPSPSAIGSDPSADFRAALSALESGDNAGAASLFTAFLGQHPGDSRTEDAAYLRVLALRRSGNSSATRQAALDYLARYPHGFRRVEVEALVR